jgi:TolB-like protein
MANFLAEFKRRHIYRIAAAYAVVAWVLLQLFNNVAPILELPPWVARAVLLLLVMGFPVALLFTWMHQLSSTEGTVARPTTGKLDWLLIGALVVVIALVSYQQLAPSQATRTALLTGVASSQLQAGGIAIAVLPFANVSGDVAQEFFSDGMTDEIMTALAKVSVLRVVGRESAFQFKGQKPDMYAVGQALHATYLIEGSVRKAGDRVRITAQLVQADNGVSLWTESYDRQLTDIFATQSDIAQAIAGALRVPLGLKPGDTLVRDRTKDFQSYDQYLRARALYRAGGTGRRQVIAILEPLVARDSDFAPGWALLADAYNSTPADAAAGSGTVEEFRRIVDVSLPKAEAAARRAIQLDANLADGYVALATVQLHRGKLLLAEDLYKQALALDPNNPEALRQYSELLAEVGRLKEALTMRQRLQALEPFVSQSGFADVVDLWLNRQENAAITMSNQGNSLRAEMLAAMGRYSEAADVLHEIPSGIFPLGRVETAERLLRTAPTAAASPQTLPPLGGLSWVYLYVGASDRVPEFYEGNIDAGYTLTMDTAKLWHPSYAPVRKTERFKAYLRKDGLVEYWRARGWPDFCRPQGTDDFVCD